MKNTHLNSNNVMCSKRVFVFFRYFFSFFFLISLYSCGPVNRFTRIKRIPREYAMNYCGGDIKASKDVWFWGDPWIVFSDKTGNVSYRTPMGKIKMKELQFMDALLVIGKQGDWLEVVKYSPDIIKGRRLQNRDKVEYYGWVSKADLLLTRNSITDLATGLKNKHISIFSDTIVLNEAKTYLKNDSIFCFEDMDLTKVHSCIPLYDIVYPLKRSEDGEKTLIAKKSYLSPDSLSTEICGWVNNSLLGGIGQQLHIDLKSVPLEQLTFKDKTGREVLSPNEIFFQPSQDLERINKSLSYTPVTKFAFSDSSFSFKTGVFMPVIDRTDNYVLNVNGNPISYNHFQKIEKNLRKINILFVVEGGETIFARFPGLINLIQGLQPLFANQTDFSYKFGAVLAFNEKRKTGNAVCELTDSYIDFLNFLSSKGRDVTQLAFSSEIRNWNALRTAVDLLKNRREEINLIILLGDTGGSNEFADYILTERLAQYNCRILGFQFYNGNSNGFNNFVSQVQNMIEGYAPIVSHKKSDLIVYANQLRVKNEFKEIDKNIYCLDFPQKSMTQGWVVFPQKKEALTLDLLGSSIDSLLTQVHYDSKQLTSSLYKAFKETGNYRSRLDSTLVSYFDVQKRDVHSLLPVIDEKVFEWYLPSQRMTFSESLSRNFDYHLLLSDAEYKNLCRFVEVLADFEVDYKFKVDKKKKRDTNKICDCDEYESLDNEIRLPSELDIPYASTRKVRNDLAKLYFAYINTDKMLKVSKKKMKMLTLSKVHYAITTCPTDTPLLKDIKIGDLLDKKLLSDNKLDALIKYFQEKKAALKKVAGNSFVSNGQTYYWVERHLLP